MKGSNQTFIILAVYLLMGIPIFFFFGWDFFLFWELSFGIGGSIFLYQQEKKEEKKEKWMETV